MNAPIVSRVVGSSRLALLVFCITALPVFAQRFSVNRLGYVDLQLSAGSNLVSNPLNGGDNSVSNLFRSVPDGSFFLPGSGASGVFGPANSFSESNGWTDPAAMLVAPNGGFLWVPSATKLSFVGEPWLGMCVTYTPSFSVLSVMPEYGCGFCASINGNCPAAIPDGTQVTLWDAGRQQSHTWTYDDFFAGDWISEWGVIGSPQLPPGQAGLFSSPSFFSARMPGLGGALSSYTNSPWMPLRRWSRTDTNLNLTVAVTDDAGFLVLCCTNLNSKVWRIVPQGTNTATNGQATLTIPSFTEEMAVYRVHPPFTPGFACLESPARTRSQFSFQFYAEAGTNYIVERSPMLGSTSWQSIATINGSGALITATDSQATNAIGYYRVRY